MKVKIADVQHNWLCYCVDKHNQFRKFCLYKATTMPELPGWQTAAHDSEGNLVTLTTNAPQSANLVSCIYFTLTPNTV